MAWLRRAEMANTFIIASVTLMCCVSCKPCMRYFAKICSRLNKEPLAFSKSSLTASRSGFRGLAVHLAEVGIHLVFFMGLHFLLTLLYTVARGNIVMFSFE